jgi:hypothetical protein
VEFRAFQSLVLRVGEARAAGDVLKRTIAQTIHPYPIQAEAIRKIGDAYNPAAHAAPSRLFNRWMAWTR